uniref:GNAT family N-acetyltransferase n=1 Tax=Tessaracoccus timonensis TaxID=2161816 RepID=UPI000D5596D3|nr:GNAT family N-acetyltransferase [Tessaracoccus timonensis]
MLTIRSINPIPATHLDPDHQARMQLFSRYNHELIGGPQWDVDVEANLASARANTEIQRYCWLAELDGVAAGYGNLAINTVDEPEVGDLTIYVAPEHRRQGAGKGLLAAINAQAHSLGLSRLTCWLTAAPPAGGATLSPAHGVGAVDADHPGIRMALSDGFELGQVERVSRYDFAAPLVDPRDALAQAQSAAGDEYEVITWSGLADDALLPDLAQLTERMSRDVPSGGLTVTPTTWTAKRIRERDERNLISNRFYRSAVRHIPTGQLVALNELLRDRSNADAFVDQWDTVVLSEHRGHRLGMAVKAANILQVREAEPTATAIITWNAEENRHMLRVNEELGFREILREAALEKQLSAEG